VELDISEIRERIRNLQEKMTRKGQLSIKEKKELNRLRDDETNLDKKLDKINSLLESDHLINKLLMILTPFRVTIGLACLGISVLILVSLLTTSIDRYFNSKCGLKCGYVLDNMNYNNYLDLSLVELSKYFHLDFLLFALINTYVYICSIYGFAKLGVKVLCLTVMNIMNYYLNLNLTLIFYF